MVFGSLSTVDRFRTAEAEALSRYNTVRSYVIETSIYLPGGRKIRAAGILRTDRTHQPLIFLASCETASPDPTLPDQTFGFAAAFRLAGASAVSAPMFAVTWLAAILVAARFYHEMTDGVAPHIALLERNTGSRKPVPPICARS